MKKKSVYERLQDSTRKKKQQSAEEPNLYMPAIIASLRQSYRLSGAELCRRAGDLDPRTLTALEKGRILNPSIKTLQSLARGFGISVADLFRGSKKTAIDECTEGTKKGHYHIDFPASGVKITSFTPLIKEFFCGKLILAARRRLEDTLLYHSKPFFISVLVGRFEVTVRDQVYSLKEGDSLFFNGILKHTFYNPLHRDSSLMLMTAPSFL